MTTLHYTYDPAPSELATLDGVVAVPVTIVSRLRGEIGDTNVANDGVDAIFSDEQLMLFYQQEGGDYNLALARIYEVLASNQALYVGKQSFLNNFTDGTAVSIELMKLAGERRAMYTEVI